MSSTASIKSLRAGEKTSVINDSGKPLRVVLQTNSGSCISTTLPLGAAIDIKLGQDSGRVFLYEPETSPERLRVIRNSEV